MASDEFVVGLELETFYLDDDSDGFGDPNVHYMSTIMPIGYAQNNLDCDDSDPNTYPEAPELCDGKDNDCDDLVDEENATGCTVYYKDADGDHYGVDEDSRCLCDADFNNQYTATLGGDPNDSNPEIKPEITINMVLNAGWSMISLPVEPADATIQTLFPDVIAVFRFTSKYELLNNTDSLVKGEGYWIYLPDADTYSVTGLPVDSYIKPNAPSGWSMIGGCSYPSQVSVSTGTIRAVFGFSTKYDLIGSGNHVGPLGTGKGYWINLSEQADMTVSQ